jgi:hypothetical protein
MGKKSGETTADKILNTIEAALKYNATSTDKVYIDETRDKVGRFVPALLGPLKLTSQERWLVPAAQGGMMFIARYRKEIPGAMKWVTNVVSQGNDRKGSLRNADDTIKPPPTEDE